MSSSPAQPKVGEIATFALRGVVPASVDWNFGDATQVVAGGAVNTHTFAMPGSFIVRATYRTTPAGAGITVQRAILVVGGGPIQIRPAAPAPGQEVTFLAPSLVRVNAQWSFGDDSPSVTTITGSVKHVYARPGTYVASAVGTVAGTTLNIQVVVGASGPAAPFSISSLALRWENGMVVTESGPAEMLSSGAHMELIELDR